MTATHTHTYPAWLEAHAVGDEHMASAYEAVHGQARADLKQTIALLHSLWGERPAFTENLRVFPAFAAQEHENPAPYALFVVEGDYAHPARLLAALMPAILAGVERILPCFTGETLPAPGLLAALELAGVEKAFALSEEPLETLAEEMRDALGRGRLISLSSPDANEREAEGLAGDLALLALRLNLPFMHLPGNEAWISQEEAFSHASAEDESPDDQPALILGPEHEGIWVWPDLGPRWFRNRRLHIFSS